MQITLDKLTPTPLVGVFSDQTQVWDTQVSFESGNSYLVLAPSGTGKSTLLLTMYGIRKDYTGDVLLDGIKVRDMDLNAWAEIRSKKLSVVFQNLRLFPDVSAFENIKLKADLTEAASENEIRAMAATLGVDFLLDRPCKTLSYGEQQRIAIIRSLVQPFEFILLDEPFSHLDKSNIEKAWKLISEKVTANNAGLIMTSLGEGYGINFDHQMIM